MNNVLIAQAAHELGYDHSFTIETDNQMWHGTDDERIYLTDEQVTAVTNKAAVAAAAKVAAKTALLAKLGITADEAELLLG